MTSNNTTMSGFDVRSLSFLLGGGGGEEGTATRRLVTV